MASDSPNSTTADVVVGWKVGPGTRGTRGTLELVWSCTITIFACTWTVLHLNVPGRDEGALKPTLRKIKWMTINIFFPEFMLSKAVCDLRLALMELREFGENFVAKGIKQRSKWTMFYDDGHNNYGHEWSWEIEYPQRSSLLYWLLFLQPPRGQVTDYQQPGITWLLLRIFPCPWDRYTRRRYPRWLRRRPSSVYELPQASPHEPSPQRSSDELLPPTSHHQTIEGNVPINRQTIQKWTVVHSYYAQIGGLLYPDSMSIIEKKDGGPDYCCLTAGKLTSRYNWSTLSSHPLKHLVLDEKDIQDKSKADWLLKSIAVLQIIWLSLSVALRRIARLPITQLEIVTLAFAAMAMLTYMANWWKPKDVSQSTVLQSIGACEDPAPDTAASDRNQSFAYLLWSPVDAAHRSQGSYDIRRVKNDSVWVEDNESSIFILLAISSLCFGGLHCLAWNFQFPTHIELMCWRVVSLTSAILPAITLVASRILLYISTEHAELRVISTFLERLEPLGEPNAIWLETMLGTWFANYGEDAWVMFVARMTGSRTPKMRHEHGNTTTDTEETKEDTEGTDEGAGKTREPSLTIEEVISIQHSLRQFRTVWEAARKVRNNNTNNNGRKVARTRMVKRILSEVSQLIKLFEDTGSRNKMVDFWSGHEVSVRNELELDMAATNVANKTWVEHVLQTCEATKAQGHEMDEMRKRCRYAARILSVCSGVTYTSARLITMTLIFTCLRAVPEGVYKITPWLRFLPNIS